MAELREIDPADKVALEFLLEEYRSHSAALHESETTGESRVNFFLTVSSAILAALLLGERSLFDPAKGVRVEVYLVLLALLLFGRLTLVRLIHRNRVTDGQKKALARIRGYYVRHTPELADYLSWPTEKPKARDAITKWQLLIPARGGLLETIMLWNALLVAFLFGLAGVAIGGTVLRRGTPLLGVLASVAAIVGLLVAWRLQRSMVNEG